MSKQVMRMPFSRNTMSMGPGSKDKKKSKYPAELDTPVDIRKVNLEVVKPWIATRITELLGGVEDEVLIGETPYETRWSFPQIVLGARIAPIRDKFHLI